MEALIGLAALTAFPLFWCAVVMLIARFGGWHRLAQLYETSLPRAPEARSFRFQSSRLGKSNYNGVLRFDVQRDGLRMSVFAPFRPGHPPLLIPWGEIADIERRSSWGFKTFAMTVGDPEVATMTVPARVVEAMRDVLPSATLPDADARPSDARGRSRERRRTR